MIVGGGRLGRGGVRQAPVRLVGRDRDLPRREE